MLNKESLNKALICQSVYLLLQNTLLFAYTVKVIILPHAKNVLYRNSVALWDDLVAYVEKKRKNNEKM